MTPKSLSPRTVVLAAAIWREELAGELVRLGLTPEAANTGALHALQHVVSRHGWPSQVYQVVPNPAADEEEGET